MVSVYVHEQSLSFTTFNFAPSPFYMLFIENWFAIYILLLLLGFELETELLRKELLLRGLVWPSSIN